MTRAANQRALFACSALAACFTIFSFRLVHLQVTMHGIYTQKAASQNARKVPITARRGTITDVHGELLAQNEPVKTVIADVSLIKDASALARLLTESLAMPVSELEEIFTRTLARKGGAKIQPDCYVIVKSKVPEATAIRIAGLVDRARAEKLIASTSAIRFEQDSVRIYPNGSMLCHVIGYIDDTGLAMEGVERSMQRYLEGREGHRFIERDGRGTELVPYRGLEYAPRHGATVRLTVDMGLQQIVEEEIDAAVKQFRPKKATIILMQPRTGEILALANRPGYDINLFKDAPALHRKNIAIMDQFEPGSTFKIVAASAALNERIINTETEIFCENGRWGWCRLRDTHPYGNLTVEGILVKSSNIGAAKLGIQLGDLKFYEYARKFGFGDRTAVNLPGEIRGSIAPPYEWSKISITRMPMGQEVAATPLQIVTSMAVIANGGRLMMPQIVRDVVADDGTVLDHFPPQEVRRVISEKVAAQVNEALIKVAGAKGTAPLARVHGFKVAGKTGTAQKYDAQGRIAHDKYAVSFVGYMPADDPAFVAIVLIDEAITADRSNYGGTVSAPIFSRVAERAARYLNLQPTETEILPGAALTKNDAGKPRATSP